MSGKIAVFLEDVAEHMDIASDETSFFYNTETGEFEFYNEYESDGMLDPKKFEEDRYVSLPSRFDIHEYAMMQRFAADVQDNHKQELLLVALEGKGAFRRFKGTLFRTELEKGWYAFKAQAFAEVAREWCDENDIPYKTKTV
jgi:hypothetical protein